MEASKFQMQRTWDSQIASENQKIAKENLGYANTWRRNAFKMENAKFGRQYSKAEEREILSFGQAPLSINISSALIDTADALALSANPVVSVAPKLSPYDNEAKKQIRTKVAEIYRFLIQNSWYSSLGTLQFDRAQRDRSVTGVGLLYAIPQYVDGEFFVEVKRIPWRYFIPDPASTDEFYRDMDNMIYMKPMTDKAAYRFVKSIEPAITHKEFEEYFKTGNVSLSNFEKDPYFGNFQEGNSIAFIQRYALEDEQSYLIIPKTIEANDIGFRRVTELTDDIKILMQRGVIKVEPERHIGLVEYTSIGDYGYKKVYGISQQSIVPMVWNHRDDPFAYSMMWDLYPIQRAFNRFLMTSILNSTLMNSVKILAEDTSIVNEDQFISTASVPNVLIKYRLPVPGYSKPPQIIPPVPLTEAHLTMPRFLIGMMEYVTGMFSVMQGNPNGAPSVFSTVASLQSAGGQKIKRRMSQADGTLSLLGEVIGEFYKQYAPLHGYAVDYLGHAKGQDDIFVKYNELTLKKIGDTPQLVVNPNNDLSTGFRKVRFTSESSSGYESATEASLMTMLATQLNIPDLVPHILERVSATGFTEIVKNMKDSKDKDAVLMQMQKTVKDLEGKSKAYEGQIFELVKRLVQAQEKGKLGVELERFKTNPLSYLQKSMNNQGQR